MIYVLDMRSVSRNDKKIWIDMCLSYSSEPVTAKGIYQKDFYF